MSVGTWKCADCGGEGYHFNLCPRLWRDPRDAEITALRAALAEKDREIAFLLANDRTIAAAMDELRAALDQEREKVKRLRHYVDHIDDCVAGFSNHNAANRANCTCGLSALLSGRGEGEGNG